MGESRKEILLVFLHAFPLSSKMWENQVRYFGDKFSVSAVDYPGFGGSSADPIPSDPTIHDYAQYVESLISPICDEFKKICLIGLSMGGYVSMALMKRQKIPISAVVLANTRAERDTDETRKRRYEIISEVEKTGSIEPVISAYLPLLAPVEGDFRKKVESIMREATPDGVKKALGAMARREDFSDVVRNFSGKLICIAGENDKLSPPEIMRKMVRDERELKIIKGAGHLTAMEKPDEFNSIVEEFLKSI